MPALQVWGRCGCWACCLCAGNLKGSPHWQALRISFRGVVPRQSSFSYSPHAPENDGTVPPKASAGPRPPVPLEAYPSAVQPDHEQAGGPGPRRWSRAGLSAVRRALGAGSLCSVGGSCANVSSRGRPGPAFPGPCCCLGSSPHPPAPCPAGGRGPGLPTCTISQPWFLAVLFDANWVQIRIDL